MKWLKNIFKKKKIDIEYSIVGNRVTWKIPVGNDISSKELEKIMQQYRRPVGRILKIKNILNKLRNQTP